MRMPPQSSVQLVLHYDGTGFAGWQRQPDKRTIQGVLEECLERLCNTPVRVTGAGRTDAGVHARGQAAGAQVPTKWTAEALHRALNAVLPPDIWVANAFEMKADFHPRFSALSRAYTYQIGTTPASRSPFRNRFEWIVDRDIDLDMLASLSEKIRDEHSFRAFAVKGTAPENDNHICAVTRSGWSTDNAGRLLFQIEANRFLHHMVRFLVGTMVEVAIGKRPESDFDALLQASDNREVSAPAPANGLFLEKVTYPEDLYVGTATLTPPKSID